MWYLKKFNESVNDYYTEIPIDSIMRLRFKDVKMDDRSYKKICDFFMGNNEWKVNTVNNHLVHIINILEGEFIRVTEVSDEYYIVGFYDDKTGDIKTKGIYKCDQIDGVIKLLEDKI